MIRLWYWLCLLFLINNISILIEESYQVVYKMINQNEPTQFLLCLNLKEIIINRTRINLKEIKEDVNCNLRWIQVNKKDKFGHLISNNTIDKIQNEIKLSDYLIYRNRICFISSNRSNLQLFANLLFNLPIESTYFLFHNDTFNFLKLKNVHSEFKHITIQHKEYPYSGCSKDYSNFKCLNDKIKKKQSLSRYYYESDDNGLIELNYQINQTIIDNEIKAINQCNQIDCKINLLHPTNKEENSELIILKSFLSISKFDFYFQLIGLIVLFLNIPIYNLIIKFIKLERCKTIRIKLNSKFNKLKYFKYLKLNYSIQLIIIICLSILFSQSIYNFIDNRDNPSMKYISIDSIESELSIVICIPIVMIKGDAYNIYNRSLLEIENDTNNGLDMILKDIYVEFWNKKISTKWQLESKLIAFYSYFHYFQRCFQLRIFLNEPEYQGIFSITKLIIEFNNYKDYVSIYILNGNELFNSNSYLTSANLDFKKKIIKRSKLNKLKKCKDYNLIDDNCESKWNCIDQCINREIYNQFKNLTSFLLIRKQYFTDKEWSNLFIIPHFYINYKLYRNISNECEYKYSKLESCIDIKFKIKSSIKDKSKLRREIKLNYDVIYHKEDEVSIFKLLLDLLNIQINLFGLNFYKCSFMILTLFKLTNLKLIKIIKLLIYLICSIGFIYHLWSIYDEIINTLIIYNEHYELINTIQTPDLIFCLDLNQTILNSNYKLTYEYLDKITEELKENKIFNKIEYLNKSNEWIKLDNKNNFKDHNLEIRVFYYLEMKCFKIIQNIDYNKNQFVFNDKIKGDDCQVMRIFLNRTYLDHEVIYFFTKTKNKIQFSKILELNLQQGYSSQLFEIKHEIVKRDEFKLIKNPLSLNEDQNDLDKFFNKFINYFDKELNFVTFKLPIEKTNLNFRKQINDDLFIKLLYKQQKIDQIIFRANIFTQHTNNYLETDYYYNRDLITKLKFSLSFYRKVIVVSNKISLIKLIINLLNVLSFWFNLGILDLHYYLSVIKFLPIYLLKLIIKIKNKFNSFLR